MTDTAVVRFTDTPITESSIVRRWSGFPTALDLPNGQRLVSPVGPEHIGMEHGNFRFVELVVVNEAAPGRAFTKSLVFNLTATQLTVTVTWTPWTQGEIDARKQTEVNRYLNTGEAAVAFALAKQITPTLTKQQFANQVLNVWPDP